MLLYFLRCRKRYTRDSCQSDRALTLAALAALLSTVIPSEWAPSGVNQSRTEARPVCLDAVSQNANGVSDTSNETLAAKLPSTTTLIERLIALGGFACLLVGVALVLRPFVTGILFGRDPVAMAVSPEYRRLRKGRVAVRACRHDRPESRKFDGSQALRRKKPWTRLTRRQANPS